MNDVRVNTIKRIWISLIISTILFIVASPNVAAMPTGIAIDCCDSNIHQGEGSLPKCCIISEYPLSHCVATNTADIKLLYVNKNISKKFYTTWQILPIKLNLIPKKLIQWVPTEELPPYYHPEYHCRNCLNSEEPPLV